MNIQNAALKNSYYNRNIHNSPNSYSISEALQLIQETANGVFRTFSRLTVLKFCPRKKKSISFSPKVTLTVFRRESPVVANVANKEQHDLRMSLKDDFRRPVQVHHQLENLGYEAPIYDAQDRVRCKPSFSNQFEGIIAEYYPDRKGVEFYSQFIESVLNSTSCNEAELALALKAYFYILIWNRICTPKINNDTAQIFSEWAIAEFTERYLEKVNEANDKESLLDGIMHKMHQRNVNQEDTYSLKEFISCRKRRPWDLVRDPQYLKNCDDVRAKQWNIAEERPIHIKQWPSYMMNHIDQVIHDLRCDSRFNEIYFKFKHFNKIIS